MAAEENLICVFLGVRFICFLFLFPHPVGTRLLFFVFPRHKLHVPTRIARGELPGVAVMRPRSHLAAGFLLGGALGGPVCYSAGIVTGDPHY